MRLARSADTPREPAQLPSGLDWPAWLGLLERKRRLLHRRAEEGRINPPVQYYVLATCGSFQLEGIAVTEADVIAAIARSPSQRAFRSPPAQRIRNHVAILHQIEMLLALGQPLKVSAIVRWYTSIGGGLSISRLSADRMLRLDSLVRRINSPTLRLQPALVGIAALHTELLIDPLFPSFNGILCRLMLRYHLGRCRLPFVIPDERVAWQAGQGMPALLIAILSALAESFDLLLETRAG